MFYLDERLAGIKWRLADRQQGVLVDNRIIHAPDLRYMDEALNLVFTIYILTKGARLIH